MGVRIKVVIQTLKRIASNAFWVIERYSLTLTKTVLTFTTFLPTDGDCMQVRLTVERSVLLALFLNPD